MNTQINGIDLLNMFEGGAKNLASDFERINSLNVFPVPDGDTGINMKMTAEGGVKALKGQNIQNIGEAAKVLARGAVLSARGNSGVILSQFFKGLSMGLDGKESVNVIEFAQAMVQGTKRSYSVVSNPTEGTILTVMREAGEEAYKRVLDNTTLDEYLASYIKEAAVSLKNTPNLLPILKKAGVIDSGGAGFLLIIEGMLKAVRGTEITAPEIVAEASKQAPTTFNASSQQEFGYCTEFILQLQNSKVDTLSFDESQITKYLETELNGNSIVIFKDEDIIKCHVHVMDPGSVLTYVRKFGELITIKVENMDVQHTENQEFFEGMNLNDSEPQEFATIVVSNGEGLEQLFKDMNVDIVVQGGQTMNTSTEDFINAFNKLNAKNIFVYPNNSNIMLAAKQAADIYNKANVIVIPTKSISEGFSAVSMLNTENLTIEEIIEAQKEIIDNINTLEVTFSIRNCNMDGFDINKDDTICLYNGKIIGSNSNRIEAIKTAFRNIEDFADKQVLTIICGNDSNELEKQEIENFVKSLNSFIEVYFVDGDQDLYSYIVGVE